MATTSCPYCGCTEIDEDPARGDTVCTGCASVLDENAIVSEVQFQEDSRGASRAVGTLTNPDGTVHSSLNSKYGGFGRTSREITLGNARRKIAALCSQLKMPSRCIETSLNFYKMALVGKLTKGRKNSHVIAACVYLTCRKEATSHMLLDFSDILQVNVYELGRTYTRLATALNIENLPVIDPSVYCLRFANQLQLGDKTHAVFMTASRIVQRMKKDWMHTGRRPAGLCGAALLVAARRHNFNRTVKDIIKVVRVCSATVRKRLTEFGETPSSRLTLDEFMNIDLGEEQDPPAFKNIRKRKLKELEEPSEEVKEQVVQFRREIEKALKEIRQKKVNRGNYHLFTPEDGASSSDENHFQKQFVLSETLKSINEDLLNNAGGEGMSEEDMNNILIPDACHQYLNEAFVVPEKGENVCIDQSLASIGVKETPEGVVISDRENETLEAVELDLDGLDDKELDAYIMNDNEAKPKIELWIRTNISYLREHTEKEAKRAREEEENANKPDYKKRRKRLKRGPIQASTTGEAIEQMVHQKRISNKLDYEVLKKLGTSSVGSDTPEKEFPEEDKVLKARVRNTKNSCTPVVPLHLKERLSAFIPSTNKWKDSSLPLDDDQDVIDAPQTSASQNDENAHVEPVPDPPAEPSYEPDAEPIVVTDTENEASAYDDCYEDGEDEENENDDGLLSAAQLLNDYRGEEVVMDYDDYQDDYDYC